MPLVKRGRIVEDRFVRVLDDAPMPDDVPVARAGGAVSGGQPATHGSRGADRRALAERPQRVRA